MDTEGKIHGVAYIGSLPLSFLIAIRSSLRDGS